MSAGIDSLIPLLIFIGVAVLSAILKKKAPDGEAPPLPPGRGHPEPRQKSWEEQLRDLLQSQVPETAPPRLPQRQAPPSLPRPASKPLHDFSKSDQHYASAASLDERMGEHMRAVTPSHVKLTHVQQRDTRAHREALNLVRHPKNVRSAILATVVLGPPKALES